MGEVFIKNLENITVVKIYRVEMSTFTENFIFQRDQI